MRTIKCVIDGKEINRRISYVEQVTPTHMGDLTFSRDVPELKPGEEIYWLYSDSRPHIVKLGE